MARVTIRTTSRWRLEARNIIEDALANVPPDFTEAQIRALLWPLYPFGEREMLPYRHWLMEQKLAIRARLGPQRGKLEMGPWLQMNQHFGTNGKPMWVWVRCGWCNDTREVRGGCLVCAPAIEEVMRLRAEYQNDVSTWAKAIIAQHPHSLPRLAFADWLGEHGFSALEVIVRKVGERMKVAHA